MKRTYGMGKQRGAKLLLSGCSAGSRGAMFSVDAVSQALGPSIEVAGFFDVRCAWLLGLVPLFTAGVPD